MPVWLPLLKASLPYVTQIVATAIPAFTSKPPAEKADKVDDVTAQQITELQAAVTQNAESIHVLAEKLQQTIQGIEVAGIELEQKIRYFKRLAFCAIAVSVVSVVILVGSIFL